MQPLSHGRKVLSVAAYAARAATDGYPAMVALGDEVPLFAGPKKCAKSGERTLTWLKQLRDNKVWRVFSPHSHPLPSYVSHPLVVLACLLAALSTATVRQAVNWASTYLFGVTCPFSKEQHLRGSPQPPSRYLDYVHSLQAHAAQQATAQAKATGGNAQGKASATAAATVTATGPLEAPTGSEGQGGADAGNPTAAAAATAAAAGAATEGAVSGSVRALLTDDFRTTVDEVVATHAATLLQMGCDGLAVGGAGMGETPYQLAVAVRSAREALRRAGRDGAQGAGAGAGAGSRKMPLVFVQEITSVQHVRRTPACPRMPP
jgi:hypothetical protein